MMKLSWAPSPQIHCFLFDRLEVAAQILRPEIDLTSTELVRAQAMGSSSRRQEFILGRSLLRRELAKILNMNPRELVIESDEKGRPRVLNSTKTFDFSFSHSGDLILLAVSLDGSPVGCDIEKIAESTDYELLSRHLFSDEEKNQLKNAPEGQRRALAFEFWCLREARFKRASTEKESVKEIKLIERGYICAVSA